MRASCPMRSIGRPQHGQALTHGARLGGGSPGFQSSNARMRSHLVFAAGLHQPPRKRLRLTRSRDDNPRAARAGGSGAKTPASPASAVSTGPCPRPDTGRWRAGPTQGAEADFQDIERRKRSGASYSSAPFTARRSRLEFQTLNDFRCLTGGVLRRRGGTENSEEPPGLIAEKHFREKS